MLHFTGITRFKKDENGNIIMLFGLSIFVLLAAVGVALESARYSVARTKMQYALDLSVLSAAAVRESQDIDQVANQFFAMNYPSEFMETTFQSSGIGGPVIVNFDPTTFTVSGTVKAEIKTIMGAFVGMDELGINQYAEVIEETFSKSRPVEVALTIDNSTSMCKGSVLAGTGNTNDPTCAKHNAVKNATLAFVDNLYDRGSEGIYVGVVPFNHNVRLPARPPEMATDPFAVWITTALPAHLASKISPAPLTAPTGLINNPASVKAQIQAINIQPLTWGFTRTNVGTLTAGMMLMPYAQDRQLFTHPAGVPHEFQPGRTDKIIVLLTDGENVTHFLNRADKDVNNDVAVISDDDNKHQSALCDLLKSHYGITVYSVTYDLPGTIESSAVKKVFHDCATLSENYTGDPTTASPYYFDVKSSAELQITYQVIAESIKRIRLYK